MRASYPKYLLRLLGARLSRAQLYTLQNVVNHMRIGRWIRDHGFRFEQVVQDRWHVFDAMASRVQDKRVLYLEFGVYKGRTTRYWSTKLRHPQTRLHGFDSFEGLPGEWASHAKGQIFNAEGRIPVIADPRVKFFKGWFDQTLPEYVVPEHDVLVLIMDADLYSSTCCVLRHLRPHIRRGTLVYFDELNHVDHEARAFEEFIGESHFDFQPVCADRTFTHACFECVGERGKDVGAVTQAVAMMLSGAV